jgi:hypothetical protein
VTLVAEAECARGLPESAGALLFTLGVEPRPDNSRC